jgi:transcription initiation factor TFIIIB Brf1 subunit/transcription initiation factor TFIIB
MVDIGTCLRHYKRPDIRRAMIRCAQGREVSVRFGDKGFGKRPDTLSYENDILEHVKQGVTSFHVSEEHWENVFRLDPSMKKKDLDENRTGWDLVLDIDSKVWEYSKLLTHLLVKALKSHGISNISVKFSGNKGFHIGVPFSSFPKAVAGEETRLWFPDGPKKIALYLSNYIDSRETDYEFTNRMLKIDSIGRIAQKLGQKEEDISITICRSCETVQQSKKDDQKTRQDMITCPECQAQNAIPKTHKGFILCSRCRTLIKLDKKPDKRAASSVCRNCGSADLALLLNPETVIELDTLLISSRHLYRMMYSLHEKSGLASVPIGSDKILGFDKSEAMPKKVRVTDLSFPKETISRPGEAHELFEAASIYEIQKNKAKEVLLDRVKKTLNSDDRNFEQISKEIPEEFFPPCIKNILKGLKDGRKRAMFALMNFLTLTGYSYDSVGKVFEEWNSRNFEPLREVTLKGQIRYHSMHKKRILPPNCRKFYEDLHVCQPDNLCMKIKNPVNYAIIKTKILQKRTQGRARLTDEQKEMRKRYREKKRKETKENQDGRKAAGQP